MKTMQAVLYEVWDVVLCGDQGMARIGAYESLAKAQEIRALVATYYMDWVGLPSDFVLDRVFLVVEPKVFGEELDD